MSNEISDEEYAQRMSVNLQKKRRKLEYTYKQLSERSGMSLPYIQNIFTGKRINPTLNSLIAVCDALDMDLKEVFKPVRAK